jgi:hypothetical protein
LDAARRHRADFSADEFAEWYADAGGRSSEAGNIGQGLKRYVAPAGQKPDALHPLIVTRQGTRGRGGNKSLFRYAFNGESVPRKTPLPQEPGDEGNDDDLTPGEFSSEPWEPDADDPTDGGEHQPDEQRPRALPGNDKINNEPAGDADQDAGDEPKPDDDDDDYDDEEPDEPDDEPTDAETQWLPQPDQDGNYAESSMFKCAAKGMGPENPVWTEISRTNNDVEAHRVVRNRFPIQLQRPAMAIAKAIFQNLNKDWDNGKAETLIRTWAGLLEMYGLGEGPERAEPLKKLVAKWGEEPFIYADQHWPNGGVQFKQDYNRDRLVANVKGDGWFEWTSRPGVFHNSEATWVKIDKPSVGRGERHRLYNQHMNDSNYCPECGYYGNEHLPEECPNCSPDVWERLYGEPEDEGNEGLGEGFSLLEDSPDDDEVPSPEKRGRISVGRVLPNYGLDEFVDGMDEQLGMYTGISEPVDFAQRDGEKRATKRGSGR